MSNRFYIILILLLIVHTCHAQVGDSDIRLHVLKANHIGKEYKFTHKDSTVTYLRYLGKVHTKTGITYKVLNSVWIWGLSHRATSRILIFNNNNRYIGNYYITDNKGKGRQCFIKTQFALTKGSEKMDLVLLEEPENHLSHHHMKLLIKSITDAKQIQLFITTHNTVISTRLDLRNSILIHGSAR